jgi:adenylate kinase family enzyme
LAGVQRVLVVGITGAGKTTMARAIGARLGLPFHQMDALAWGPGWSEAPDLERTVELITAGPRWVFDSLGYARVTEMMWDRADTIVWLDYSRRITFSRAFRRSVVRTARREEIFNGNRETWRDWLTRDHPAWWSWTEHPRRRALISARLGEPRNQHLAVHRLGDPRAARRWLDQLSA